LAGTVCGGETNSIGAGGNHVTIAGGISNTCAGTRGAIGGGVENSITTSFAATIPGGRENTVTADYGVAIGYAARASREGQLSHAGGQFASTGDAQFFRVLVWEESSGAAPVVLTTDGGNNFNLEDDMAYAIRATVIMSRINGAGRASVIHDMLAHASAGAAVIDNDNTTLSVSNGEAWAVAFSASGPDIVATFTGTVGHDVYVVCCYECVATGGSP
jgi:hypothetical protein